jgi:hypothetical protein
MRCDSRAISAHAGSLWQAVTDIRFRPGLQYLCAAPELQEGWRNVMEASTAAFVVIGLTLPLIGGARPNPQVRQGIAARGPAEG